VEAIVRRRHALVAGNHEHGTMVMVGAADRF
jgi:hypothetical protein